MKKRTITKITSTLVIFSLVFSDLARANPTLISNAASSEGKPRFELSLPPELGTVRETFFPEGKGNGPFIFHVETVHANYEAALRVRDILRYLAKEYRVKLLFEEGGTGELHPEFLQFFPDRATNEKMLDRLAQKANSPVRTSQFPTHPSRRLVQNKRDFIDAHLRSFKK